MHEENCGDFSKCSKIIRIGLPKGNVYEKSKKLVANIIGEDIPKGKLFINYKEYFFHFLKHRDIPILIQKGFLDFGITSDEWVKESGVNLLRLKELDWCDTEIALIVHKDNSGLLKKCVTEWINLTKKFFEDSDLEIEYISGSCESLVPIEFDCCVGCVESGATLKQNDLIVKDVILQSKIVLVGKENVSRYEIDKICELLIGDGNL